MKSMEFKSIIIITTTITISLNVSRLSFFFYRVPTLLQRSASSIGHWDYMGPFYEGEEEVLGNFPSLWLSISHGYLRAASGLAGRFVGRVIYM